VARTVHRLSVRAAKPFLPIHCAALSESLLESELFGHVKGAYTGATSDSAGLFVAAKGGTVFLDEIGEIPPSIQVKLLRVLQEREVTPVGGVQASPIDVRIVAATNANLEQMVHAGTFREDLYYRLNVIRIVTPPLRERHEDLAALASTLLERIARRLQRPPITLTQEAVAHLGTHSWPGNIRELENVLERSAVLCPRQILGPSDIIVDIQEQQQSPPSPLSPSLETVQKAYIYWVLAQNQWRRPQAAAILGIDPTRLQRMIEHYGLQDSTINA
jgi:transcriptional regulator with PAS, ATPase and Fis domain